ncbi:hypothetical protein S2091_1536 [Solimicrobium silvestre]|uniref:Uncharacterized protein n=1 Tax=Solimicrobium silvestre TaxID=2099400 RepID=A0A2S9H1T9_9BURK|nr:hypothetical protein S2091_1536 [Solimicrobium silvestre]
MHGADYAERIGAAHQLTECVVGIVRLPAVGVNTLQQLAIGGVNVVRGAGADAIAVAVHTGVGGDAAQVASEIVAVVRQLGLGGILGSLPCFDGRYADVLIGR